MSSVEALADKLFQETLIARQRVYAIRPPTPLEKLTLSDGTPFWIKREDQPPIYAYKWRGAYNAMSCLSKQQQAKGVVCASAGNHAQGVAVSANKLSCHATIFMPCSTPAMKRQAVVELGKEYVDIRLVGDSFDEAANAAKAFQVETESVLIHPYDALLTMAGQGTLADEIAIDPAGQMDVVFLPIGGGGMAAAVACYFKRIWPQTRIIGVEGEGQASMKAAFAAGKPVCLDSLDIFCDGTAVREAGSLTYPLCRHLLDEIVTVDNAEVCSAIRVLWDRSRSIVEPGGALGLAGLLKYRHLYKDKRMLTLASGSNLDFAQLSVIAAEAGIDGRLRRHLQIEINEFSGTLLHLIEEALSEVDIVDFQYGKTDMQRALPVLGIDATPQEFVTLQQKLDGAGISWRNVTMHEDVEFRMIHFDVHLMKNPWFIHLSFPERPGALREFLRVVDNKASLVYFNYHNTGERIGRALLGFEFDKPEDQAKLQQTLSQSPHFVNAWKPLGDDALQRIFVFNT